MQVDPKDNSQSRPTVETRRHSCIGQHGGQITEANGLFFAKEHKEP
jgi:hypothetical protein